MSTDRDVTRIVRSWMDEGVTQLPDRVLDAVLDQLPATPQRRPSRLARRFLSMNTYLKFGLAAAAVVAAVVIGLQFIGQPNIVGPPDDTPTPSVAEPSASVGPQALPMELGLPISSGTYALSGFPVGITLEVPTVASPIQWKACSENNVEQGVCYWPTAADTAGQLAFLIVENVVADPCDPGWADSSGALLDPPAGPSVDDLVTAMTSLPGFEATTPVDYTLNGFDGKQFTLTAGTACDSYATWATELRTAGVGPGSVNLVHVLDVDGVRVVITIDSAPNNQPTFQGVLDSVQIEP